MTVVAGRLDNGEETAIHVVGASRGELVWASGGSRAGESSHRDSTHEQRQQAEVQQAPTTPEDAMQVIKAREAEVGDEGVRWPLLSPKLLKHQSASYTSLLINTTVPYRRRSEHRTHCFPVVG